MQELPPMPDVTAHTGGVDGDALMPLPLKPPTSSGRRCR
jgi:hypothetical protein